MLNNSGLNTLAKKRLTDLQLSTTSNEFATITENRQSPLQTITPGLNLQAYEWTRNKASGITYQNSPVDSQETSKKQLNRVAQTTNNSILSSYDSEENEINRIPHSKRSQQFTVHNTSTNSTKKKSKEQIMNYEIIKKCM